MDQIRTDSCGARDKQEVLCVDEKPVWLGNLSFLESNKSLKDALYMRN